jgi:acyl carrier protein
MKTNDPLKQLLTEFLGLRADTVPAQLSQQAIAQWDSFAMVQLIMELEAAFSVKFTLDELDQLTDYAKIQAALTRKGASL